MRDLPLLQRGGRGDFSDLNLQKIGQKRPLIKSPVQPKHRLHFP